MKNILIVDDSSTMQMALKILVKDIEVCNCLGALTFDNAIDILNNKKVDVLITDIFLKNDSGIDIVREVRAGRTNASRDIPIIAISGESSVDIVLKTQLLGCNFFLTKPVSIDALKKHLSRASRSLINIKQSEFYDSIKAHINEYTIQSIMSQLTNSGISTDVMLVYTSKATCKIEISDIESIIEKSSKNNAQKGITGALFYNDGYFLQFLEGEMSDIKDRLSVICSDERHKDINIILMSSIKTRMFERWAMGYARFESEEVINDVAFTHSNENHISFEQFDQKNAVKLINSFSSGEWKLSD